MLAVSAEGSKGRRRLVFGSDAIHPCTMLQDSAHRARSVTVCTLCEYVLQAAERSQQRRGSKIPESSIICRLLRGGMCARANPWTDPRLFWAIPTSYVRKGVVPKYQFSDMAKLPTMSTVSDVDVLVSAHVQQEWISASKNISTKAQTNSCDGVIYIADTQVKETLWTETSARSQTQTADVDPHRNATIRTWQHSEHPHRSQSFGVSSSKSHSGLTGLVPGVTAKLALN